MSQYDLNILISTGEAVANVNNLATAGLPRFVQGDSLKLRIFLLTPNGSVGAYVPVSGITLQVALGAMPSTGSYYAQQFTWEPSVDLAQPYFEAVLSLNTAAINVLLADATDSPVWFEVKMIQDGLPTTVLSKATTIYGAVILPTVLTVPAGQTPLSAEAAAATFLGRTITGAFTIKSADGSKSVLIYVDAADGSFHADPVT